MTEITATATTPEATEPKAKIVKLNAESFKAWKDNQTVRSQDEERCEKPRLTHEPQGKRESVGYYHTRRLAFDVTLALTGKGREFSTPQSNLDLLTATLASKGVKVARTVYVAKTFGLRFFLADAPKGEFLTIGVETQPTVAAFRKTFGLK